jgi:hypothetical protein
LQQMEAMICKSVTFYEGPILHLRKMPFQDRNSGDQETPRCLPQAPRAEMVVDHWAPDIKSTGHAAHGNVKEPRIRIHLPMHRLSKDV